VNTASGNSSLYNSREHEINTTNAGAASTTTDQRQQIKFSYLENEDFVLEIEVKIREKWPKAVPS